MICCKLIAPRNLYSAANLCHIDNIRMQKKQYYSTSLWKKESECFIMKNSGFRINIKVDGDSRLIRLKRHNE